MSRYIINYLDTYILAPSAVQDLNNIADYFLNTNIQEGERLFSEFNKKCSQLVQFPNLGRSYNHIKPLLRGFPLDGYIVFYRVINGIPKILSVVNDPLSNLTKNDIALSAIKDVEVRSPYL